MATLTDVRIAIHDNGTSTRYTDAEVTSLMQRSIDEVNVWCKTSYSLTDLDTPPSDMPSYFSPLFFMVVKLMVTAADMNDLDRYAKFVTQDTQYDPQNVQQTLTRVYWNLRNELEDKLKKWGVIGQGAVVAFEGENPGGGVS